MSTRFQFDAATHRYTIDGAPVPSVTKVIAETLPRNYSCPDWYLNRGSAMHKAIHLLIQGKLDWSSVDERIERRIWAFERFRKENGIRIEASETPLYSQRYFFAGTIDLALSISKRADWTLGDIKSSLEPQLLPQLGGYSILMKENGQEPTEALGLWLRDDGNYRTKWFNRPELRRAEQLFLALLTIYNFGKREGIFE